MAFKAMVFELKKKLIVNFVLVHITIRAKQSATHI